MAFLKHRQIWRYCIAAFLALAMSGFALGTARAENISLSEQKIKAGLLYNFLKYTEWPKEGGILNVCLFQDDPFGGSLDPLKGRTAQQFRINVTTIYDVGQMDGCSVVFVPANAAESVPAVLSHARSKQILTMSDIRGFAREGGMIELATREDQRIHILINGAAAAAADIRIEPRMKRLAEMVGP